MAKTNEHCVRSTIVPLQQKCETNYLNDERNG